MADEGRKRKMQRKKGANLMKNLFKKIGALLVAAVMVLSMCTAAFAATKNKATITVNNADGATLEYAQVIKTDRGTRTGWNFVNPEVAQAYMDALGKTDAQSAIDTLTTTQNDAAALKAAQVAAAQHVTFTEVTNGWEVDDAGVYLVKAVQSGFTYNTMSAYVSFTKVENYDYPSLKDTAIDAKKIPTTVTKEITVGDTDKNNVVKTGDVLTYQVKAFVPFIDAAKDTDRTFFVYDQLTGAKYVNKDEATITVNDQEYTTTTIQYDDKNGKFSLDLSSLVDSSNSKAGQEVVITYKVEVTSENDEITNTAKAGHTDGEQFGGATTRTFEGNITLTKYASDSNNEDLSDNEKLANAGFEVKKDNTVLKFTKLGDGLYKYDSNGDVAEVFTTTGGTVKIQGLDVGTYTFTEKTAPEGYSVNQNSVTATLEIKETDKDSNGVVNKALTSETSMIDTKLSSLPSTGGMGTYLFTIIGVVVMAGAAGAFFISRRKGSEE